MSEDTDLTVKLQRLETALDDVAAKAKEAYRVYRALDAQQTALGYEIREIRRLIAERT